MDEKEGLTIERIDNRLSEIPARLKELDEQIKTKTEELGKSKIRGLLTPPILKSLRGLEDNQRELLAESEVLTQERDRIEKENAQRATEAAAIAYQTHHDQLTPLANELIQSLCNAQSLALEIEKIEALMDGERGTAGDLVSPISGVIRIHPSVVNHIDRALLQIISYNGRENLKNAGIEIPDLHKEREKIFGAIRSVVTGGPAETQASTPDDKPGPVGFDEAMRRGADLPVE